MGFVNVLFLFCAPLTAQINGKVTDSVNNPMRGVSVYIKDSFVGTVSNEDGAFYLGDLPYDK